MAYERLAAHEGNVHGTMFPNEVQHAVDKRRTAKIVEFTQDFAAAQMRIAVSVTSGATKRALAGYLDREYRRPAG
jgi:hypothetical protein